MLGVTSQLSTDVGSAPFLWVVPLALYLLTFILAFGDSKLKGSRLVLTSQAIAALACVFSTPFHGVAIELQLAVHLSCFFLTALVCHGVLAARRPAHDHLTLFYLCLSIGGVIGGCFNALLAPVIFKTVVEYPLVLTLACLARPWGGATMKSALNAPRWMMISIAGVVAASAGMVFLPSLAAGRSVSGPGFAANVMKAVTSGGMAACLFLLAIACAFLVRNRALYFTVCVGVVAVCAAQVGDKSHLLVVDRSFFGVIKVTEAQDPVIGPIHQMMHGTTLHGAQALTPGQECRPITYYAPNTPIGESVAAMQSVKPGLTWATVGLGTGALAVYVRPTDRLTYYEIDPLVVRYATDPKYFTYTTHCAKAPVQYQLGDARLTIGKLAPASQDFMIVDAFSSDAVPAHLLTVEAINMYFSKLRPDGVLLFHLSNRHLELRDPVLAAVHAAGGYGLSQLRLQPGRFTVAATSSSIVIASRSPRALDPMVKAGGFVKRDPGTVKPWTDDYTNEIGAMLAHK
jgi:SAM-dependent methyltransferase